MKPILLFLVTFLACGFAKHILNVPGYGKINGTDGTSLWTERPYYAFHTLHYAKQPTNETRFLPPVPVDPLPEDEVYDAITFRRGCSQAGVGSENCLFFNIYTPLIYNESEPGPTDRLLPVMYWIHGGAFSTGEAILYTPWKLMEADVVLVDVQYRLGALGFLCLDTDEVPGNAGLFDQIEGLRWVQKFIKYFGGDPNKVTVFGESAGSASVSALMVIPQARGLFHRVIGESGAILADWAIDRNSAENSRKIAEFAGCPLEPYEDLLYCLRNVPDDTLVKAYSMFEAYDRARGGLGFGGSSPVIQKAGKEKLITEDPLILYQEGRYATDVPIMFGANKHEGSLVLGQLYNDFLKPNNLTNDTDFFRDGLVRAILTALGVQDETEIAAIQEEYLGCAEMGNWDSMIPGLLDICSVYFLKSPAYQVVQLHSTHNPDNAYWYAFHFTGRYSLFFYLFFGERPPIPHGVGHADELIYLFTYPGTLNDTEKEVSYRMLSMWTNFAEYGNPTPDGVEPIVDGIPKFLPYSQNEAYMDIDYNLTVKYDYTQTFGIAGDEAYDKPCLLKKAKHWRGRSLDKRLLSQRDHS